MRYAELTERRQGLFGFVQQSFPYPPWPPYIVNDWHYKTIKDMQSQEEIAEYITTMNQIYGKVQWREQPLEITLNIFDPGTQQRIKQRVGGTANPMGVYNDAERHTTAQQLLQQKGISKEPIIVVKTPQGYELLEGWHRTIQYLQAFPQGYHNCILHRQSQKSRQESWKSREPLLDLSVECTLLLQRCSVVKCSRFSFPRGLEEKLGYLL